MNKLFPQKPPSETGTEDALDMVEISNITEHKSLLAPPSSRRQLFEDESDSINSGEDVEKDGAPPGSDSTAFKINKEYARRFEHNKKREEKQRLEEKYGSKPVNGTTQGDEDGSSSSEDETEDEDAFLLTEELDAQMSAALSAIKNKDPRIYDGSARFYDDPEDSKATRSKEKEQKPVFLRDYHRERYLRGDIELDDEEGIQEKPKTYTEEQEELKQSLLAEINAAVEDDSEQESDGEAFIKAKDEPPSGENGVHASRAARVRITDLDVENADKDPELYLSNFMTSKAWLPTEGSRWEAFDSDEEDPDNNVADDFEVAYNLRFEDPAKSNEVLKSYSRNMAAARSVRREEKTGRKRQREVEKERKEAEKKERREERARLRKLKLEEAQEKLQKIKQAAGMSGKSLAEDKWMKLLDDVWDDDKWEDEMRKKFGAEYYAEEDDAVAAGSDDDDAEDAATKSKIKGKKKPKKPKWDDDIDIKDIVSDFEDEDVQPNITLSDSEAGAAEDAFNSANQAEEDVEEDEDGDDDRPAKKRMTNKDHKKARADAKRAVRVERSRLEALVDARMELDAPSVLVRKSQDKQPSAAASSSAAPPSFRYRETSPISFGLTARDILMAPSDAALNEFAGLKKLAAFRDAERKRHDRKRLGKKARLRQWRRDNFGAGFEDEGPAFVFGGDGGGGRGAVDGEISGGNGGKGSRPHGDGDEDGVQAGSKKKRKRSKGKKGKAAV